MRTVLTEARVFTGDTFLDDHAVSIVDGVIQTVQPAAGLSFGDSDDSDTTLVRLHGALLAPGFIDVQVNGGGGVLFNDEPTVAGIEAIAHAHRRFGTTRLLPTLITDRPAVMDRALQAVGASVNPGILGIHLEGPFINPARKGVHNAAYIRPWQDDLEPLLERTSGLGTVLITLAPECVPLQAINTLAARGLIVAAGHTVASFAQVQNALRHGLRGFTHLFNAMTQLGSREPGVVGAALADRDSWCAVINDGVHVHPETLKIALKAKPPGKLLLVTDAMPGVGSEDKRFSLYGNAIHCTDGRCLTADGVLAGSDLDMAGAVRNCLTLLDLPLGEALRMASLYPAQFLRLDDCLGRIAPGYRADFVLLDDQLNVLQTWLEGQPGPGLAGG